MKKKLKKVVKNFLKVLKRPEMSILPGHLAFYFLMSLVPIIALAALFASKLTINLDLLSFVNDVIPASFMGIINSLIESATSYNNLLLLLFFYILLGSKGPAAIVAASDTLYGIKQRGYLETKIKSMIMTMIMVVLILFIVIIPVFGDSLIKLLIKNFSFFQGLTQYAFLYEIIKIVTSFFVIYINVKLLYTMAPDKDIKSRNTTFGAMFTTLSWMLATECFSFYITKIAKYNLLYGNFANVLVLLLWVYLLAFLFVVGIAINVNLYEDKEKEIGSDNSETKATNDDVKGKEKIV